MLVLLVALYVFKPLDFSLFPTVLLLTTLLRLSLNVASTRVVLLQGHTGPDAAGKVIEAFGHFLVGNNYAVGIVVFAVLVVIFTVLGWPTVARGVRGVMLSEREQEYVQAARASGASPWRILVRHLLPAARGYVVNQATLLLPAFIVAEATMSYIGLGFPDTTPTWGTMLQEASNVALLGDAPWTLAPAAAIFLVVLAVHLAVREDPRTPVQLLG